LRIPCPLQAVDECGNRPGGQAKALTELSSAKWTAISQVSQGHQFGRGNRLTFGTATKRYFASLLSNLSTPASLSEAETMIGGAVQELMLVRAGLTSR
jgi:hypothetical protein